jgi:hypothetical protein
MSTTGYFEKPWNGYLGPMPTRKLFEFMEIDNKVEQIYDVIVHRFQMGDVEDPDLYAAHPLIEWQKSEMGEWIMEHAMESPMWHRHVDHSSYGHSYAITAKLRGRDHTFWQLKWGTKP